MKDILRQGNTHWELLTMNYVLLTIDCKLRIIDYELRTKLFQAKQIKKLARTCHKTCSTKPILFKYIHWISIICLIWLVQMRSKFEFNREDTILASLQLCNKDLCPPKLLAWKIPPLRLVWNIFVLHWSKFQLILANAEATLLLETFNRVTKR